MSKKERNFDTFAMRHSFDPFKPHDLAPLPPAIELETRQVLKQCIRSRASLAELDRAADLLPDPGILLSTLPILEARASTEIENIVTTNDQLFREMDRTVGKDPATKEALRYRGALLAGFDQLEKRPLGTGSAEEIAATILGVETRVRTVPGTTLQNSRGDVIYTPPVGEPLLRDLLANWEAFLHEENALDPLVRMAVAHYQFEAIHPFLDGNGRAGRVLNSLFLVDRGLLRLPILYASRSIIRRKAEYYERLLGVTRDADWEPWILYMLEIVEDASTWTLGKALAIRDLIAHIASQLRRGRPGIYSHELVELVFERPYCRIDDFVRAGLGNRQTAAKHLRELVALELLQEQKHGREVLFVNRQLLRLLEGS